MISRQLPFNLILMVVENLVMLQGRLPYVFQEETDCYVPRSLGSISELGGWVVKNSSVLQCYSRTYRGLVTATWIRSFQSSSYGLALLYPCFTSAWRNSFSGCLKIPIHSLELQLRTSSVKPSLAPTFSLLLWPTWLHISRSAPCSEFSRSDSCFLQFWSWPGFFPQPLTNRSTATQEAGNQLCNCEIFDLRQDFRLLKWELCNLGMVQWAGGPHWEQIWRMSLSFWCDSTKASTPPSPSQGRCFMAGVSSMFLRQEKQI